MHYHSIYDQCKRIETKPVIITSQPPKTNNGDSSAVATGDQGGRALLP